MWSLFNLAELKKSNWRPEGLNTLHRSCFFFIFSPDFITICWLVSHLESVLLLLMLTKYLCSRKLHTRHVCYWGCVQTVSAKTFVTARFKKGKTFTLVAWQEETFSNNKRVSMLIKGFRWNPVLVEIQHNANCFNRSQSIIWAIACMSGEGGGADVSCDWVCDLLWCHWSWHRAELQRSLGWLYICSSSTHTRSGRPDIKWKEKKH